MSDGPRLNAAARLGIVLIEAADDDPGPGLEPSRPNGLVVTG